MVDYNPINLYLEKFKKILNQTSFNKEMIISVIKDEIKYELKDVNFKIKNYTITLINISPILKNEIYIHKDRIINKLKESGLNIKDIR